MLGTRIEAARRTLVEREPGDWSARIVEESPDGRAVVSFESETSRATGTFSGDGRGEETFALLHALSRARCATLRVTRPIAWLREHGALLTEVPSGVACGTLNLAADSGTIARIGRALGELHSIVLPTTVNVPGPRKLADHVAELMQPAPWTMARRLPAYAQAISHTLARLSAEEGSWGVTPVALLHRSFHVRRLFDDGAHITVIDWDDAALGDPAFDVGYVTAHLRTHYSAVEAELAVSAFHSSYGGAIGVWERVAAYERFNYLRRACRRFRLRDEGWRESLEGMLTRMVG